MGKLTNLTLPRLKLFFPLKRNTNKATLCSIRVCNNYDELSDASVRKPTQQRMEVSAVEPSTGACRSCFQRGEGEQHGVKTCLDALSKKNDVTCGHMEEAQY